MFQRTHTVIQRELTDADYRDSERQDSILALRDLCVQGGGVWRYDEQAIA